MKKLLCVLMFGMVFGQTELTTRVYIIEDVYDDDIINLTDVIGVELDYYLLSIIDVYPLNSSTLWHRLNSTQNAHGVEIQETQNTGVVWDDVAPYQNVFRTMELQYNGCWCNATLTLSITAEFPEEDTGYIEEGFDYCIEEGANLIASPCRDTVPILDALPSEIANNLTGIIGAGVAATNEDGNWVGSLSGLGGGSGYWMLSNVNACFNYNCSEN
jgi:hypothetical protein